jgi:hypothetical protein
MYQATEGDIKRLRKGAWDVRNSPLALRCSYALEGDLAALAEVSRIIENARLVTSQAEREAVSDDDLVRGADGLTVAAGWVRLGGCPTWRGYDPDDPRQHEHAAAEETFAIKHGTTCAADDAGGADRCGCGGLYCGCGEHYPASFLTELPHGTQAPTA